MIRVVIPSEEVVYDFDTLGEALDEVLDFSGVTMIDTHTKTTYVYNEFAALIHEEQFEDDDDEEDTSLKLTPAEVEILKQALDFVVSNSDVVSARVLRNIQDKF